ncbi:MAG: CTB family bacteriocin [Nostoc sp.]|uniref:CTB family bacteriocin n=1 Tax=Nostoc sp. TaxID=1180 RepID=UPI002FF9631B
MSDNLFIDVTEEQQESVAGGVEVLSLETFYKRVSQVSESIGPVAASSGPTGSSIVSFGVSKSVLDSLQTSNSLFGLVF